MNLTIIILTLLWISVFFSIVLTVMNLIIVLALLLMDSVRTIVPSIILTIVEVLLAVSWSW